MDGNGRWANERGLRRTAGHRKGADSVKECIKTTAEIGVEYLTLFGFSSENWNRPEEEVTELMGLMKIYLKSEIETLKKNNIRLKIIGEKEGLSDEIVSLMNKAEDYTKDNNGLKLQVAINYGSKNEIMQAVYDFALSIVKNQSKMPERKEFLSDEYNFSRYLMTKDIPDPDLLIRTSGEKRISNFLLWQCAYAEFVFIDTLWPDFSKKDLEFAITEFAQRKRRFGRV